MVCRGWPKRRICRFPQGDFRPGPRPSLHFSVGALNKGGGYRAGGLQGGTRKPLHAILLHRASQYGFSSRPCAGVHRDKAQQSRPDGDTWPSHGTGTNAGTYTGTSSGTPVAPGKDAGVGTRMSGRRYGSKSTQLANTSVVRQAPIHATHAARNCGNWGRSSRDVSFASMTKGVQVWHRAMND